jgi:hypothetical protein
LVRLFGVRLRLSDPSQVHSFVGFLAVPQLTVNRLINNDIQIQPSSAAQSETHELLVQLMLQAWNAAHPDAEA